MCSVEDRRMLQSVHVWEKRSDEPLSFVSKRKMYFSDGCV